MHARTRTHAHTQTHTFVITAARWETSVAAKGFLWRRTKVNQGGSDQTDLMSHSVPLMTLSSLEGRSSECARPLPTGAWEIRSRIAPWTASAPPCLRGSARICPSCLTSAHSRSAVVSAGCEPTHFPQVLVGQKKRQKMWFLLRTRWLKSQHWSSEVFPGSQLHNQDLHFYS